MEYTKFEIFNFRGIEHVALSLESRPRGRVHTLVGLNESGKTTILEAIDYFRAKESNDLSEVSGRSRPARKSLVPASKRSNFNDSVKICATVQLSEADVDAVTAAMKVAHPNTKLVRFPTTVVVQDLYKFQNSISMGQRSVWVFELTATRGKARKPKHLTHDDEEWQTFVKLVRDRLPEVWYFPNFLFDFPEKIYLQQEEGGDAKTKFYVGLVDDILKALDPNMNVQQHLLERALSEEEEAKQALDGLILQCGSHLTEKVFGDWDRMFSRKVTDKRVDLQLSSDARGPFLQFRIVDANGAFLLSERSLGFRWFFVFILLTAFRTPRAGDAAVLFLFDEPASNLHATAQSRLLKSLGKLSENSVIIYTTHSHHLINAEWLENTYVVRNLGLTPGDDGLEHTADKTDIRLDRYRSFVSKHPGSTEYFQPILDMLEYRPSDLELVPDVVIVEGKNDFYTLRYFEKTHADSKLNLVPGLGSGHLDPLIRLYIGWGRNFLVVLDGDKAGNKERARYEELYGPFIAGRLTTLTELTNQPAVKKMEDVVEEGDRLALQNLVDPTSTKHGKKEFNRAVQEALARRIELPLSQAAANRLEALFEAISGLLEALESEQQ